MAKKEKFDDKLIKQYFNEFINVEGILTWDFELIGRRNSNAELLGYINEVESHCAIAFEIMQVMYKRILKLEKHLKEKAK